MLMATRQRKTIRVDGYPLTTIAAYDGLTWSYRAEGGCWEASWAMQLPPLFRHPALVGPKLVELFNGPVRIWRGYLAKWDRREGTFAAVGHIRALEGYTALNASNDATSILDVAIDEAIDRGLPVTRPVSLSNTAFTGDGTTSGVNYLHTLAGEVANEQGKRVVVNEDGQIRLVADPTTPAWQLVPGVADLGPAEEGRASTLVGRYRTSGGYATAIAQGDDRYGHKEEPVDLTNLGVITAGKAATMLNGLMAKGAARTGLTDQVEASPYEVQTLGGQPAWDTSAVRAGQMIRVHGAWDDVVDLNGRTYIDLLVGESRHNDADDTVQLIPLDAVPFDLSAALETIGRRGRRRYTA